MTGRWRAWPGPPVAARRRSRGGGDGRLEPPRRYVGDETLLARGLEDLAPAVGEGAARGGLELAALRVGTLRVGRTLQCHSRRGAGADVERRVVHGQRPERGLQSPAAVLVEFALRAAGDLRRLGARGDGRRRGWKRFEPRGRRRRWFGGPLQAARAQRPARPPRSRLRAPRWWERRSAGRVRAADRRAPSAGRRPIATRPRRRR